MRWLSAHGLLVLGAVLALHSPVLGFTNIKVGDPVPDVSLRTFTGDTHPLLAERKVNVILFFRPDQAHSIDVATQLARKLEPEMASKPVQFVGVISARYSVEAVDAFIATTGLRMPILADDQDALVGTFGVILQPCVGVVDLGFKLADYRPFMSINLLDIIRGQIRYILGEITREELEDIIAPVNDEINQNRVKAQRRLGFARAYLKQGKLGKAMEEVQKALEHDMTLAAAHSFYGKLLALQGDCPKALEEFEIALKLDPKDPDALEGIKGCQKVSDTFLMLDAS